MKPPGEAKVPMKASESKPNAKPQPNNVPEQGKPAIEKAAS